MAVLCMLYKIRCNPVYPLNGALPRPYVQARVTRGALVAHRYTYSPHRCRTLQYSRTFIPFSVSLWYDLANPVFDGLDWRVSIAGPMLLYWPKLLYPCCSLLLFFPFSSFCYRLVLWGWGLRTDRVYTALSQPCTADLYY